MSTPRFEMPPEPERPEGAPGEDPAPSRDDGGPGDPVALLGAGVALLAAAGVCALLADQLLLGVLHLAAGILAGLALGAGLLALRRPRRWSSGRRALLGGAAATGLAAILTVPAIASTRVGSLPRGQATTRLAAPGEGDSIVTVPGEGTAVMVRRADSRVQLLLGDRVEEVDVPDGMVPALSADGTVLALVGASGSEVRRLDGGQVGSPIALDGELLSLSGGLAVVRTCSDGACRLSSHDLEGDPATALWTVLDGTADEERRLPDASGSWIEPGADHPATMAEALAPTGILPAVALRYDAAQGWTQIDPQTGFPLGRVLARPEDDCRIAAQIPAPGGDVLGAEQAEVLAVRTAEDGSLQATAFRQGEEQWSAEASPAGEWRVLLDGGRVLASGRQDGAEQDGELIASVARPGWTAPGGEALADASAFRVRVGIDGTAMVVANDLGQLAAYDPATGADMWSTGTDAAPEDLRGDQRAGTAAVLTPALRERPLDPRGATRVRIIDVRTGEFGTDLVTATDIDAVRALGGGRALVISGADAHVVGQ